jgi:hypothetical protein
LVQFFTHPDHFTRNNTAVNSTFWTRYSIKIRMIPASASSSHPFPGRFRPPPWSGLRSARLPLQAVKRQQGLDVFNWRPGETDQALSF